MCADYLRQKNHSAYSTPKANWRMLLQMPARDCSIPSRADSQQRWENGSGHKVSGDHQREYREFLLYPFVKFANLCHSHSETESRKSAPLTNVPPSYLFHPQKSSFANLQNAGMWEWDISALESFTIQSHTLLVE